MCVKALNWRNFSEEEKHLMGWFAPEQLSPHREGQIWTLLLIKHNKSNSPSQRDWSETPSPLQRSTLLSACCYDWSKYGGSMERHGLFVSPLTWFFGAAQSLHVWLISYESSTHSDTDMRTSVTVNLAQMDSSTKSNCQRRPLRGRGRDPVCSLGRDI